MTWLHTVMTPERQVRLSIDVIKLQMHVHNVIYQKQPVELSQLSEHLTQVVHARWGAPGCAALCVSLMDNNLTKL